MIDAKFLRYSFSYDSDLLHGDNVKNQESNKMLEQIGGYSGLENVLKTNLKVLYSLCDRWACLPTKATSNGEVKNLEPMILLSNPLRPSWTSYSSVLKMIQSESLSLPPPFLSVWEFGCMASNKVGWRACRLSWQL